MTGVRGLLGADRRVRVLLTCSAALVAANSLVVAARLSDDATREPEVVADEKGGSGTVLILGADGQTISVDPSSPEGKAAIAAAEERGDTVVTGPTSDDPDVVAAEADGDEPADAAESAALLDAADGVVDGIIEVVDAATGEIVQRTVQQVEDAIERTNISVPNVTTPGSGEPLVSVTTPGVTITTPEVTVTTPGVTVTTPGVTVTTPPVTVSTPITTVTVPTTTVTVPTTTVTVPTTTVTIPPTTVTVTVPTTTTTIVITTTTLLGL